MNSALRSESGAWLSKDKTRRFRLWRCWNPKKPRLLFCCLNPSTADASKNDASIRKMVGFASLWGYGAIDVVNLFDLRSRDPKALYDKTLNQVCSEQNLREIAQAVKDCRKVIVAWGGHGQVLNQSVVIEALLH